MSGNDDLAVRVAHLEERLAWFERHATEQDKAMLELAETTERLRAEVKLLRERGGAETGPGGGGVEERPPHY
jgi:SlyX protein